ncbi:MAG: 23S rRNA (uracil(1939)-C(5))-methyltransferase RlmD [Flavobacteriales bacterium]
MNQKNNILKGVVIKDIGAKGKAVGKSANKVVFVPGLVPGDVADIKITKKKKKYFEGKPVEFLEYSNRRKEAFCEHFELCGGCKWQHIPYEDQLYYKEKQVKDNLSRIGEIPPDNMEEILPSPKTEFYRNKLEYTFTNRRWLTKEEIDSGKTVESREGIGFHIPGQFDKIVDIRKCHLQPEPSNSIRLFIRRTAIDHGLEFFDVIKQKGFLRNLIIRTSTTGEVMVILVFFKEEAEKRKRLLNALKEEFPDITSICYIINSKKNDSIADQQVHAFKGRKFIVEELGGIKYRIGPKSFFQTNSYQAKQLYDLVTDYAELHGSEIVYDLYTGIGTIANYIAPKSKRVIGIESIEEAVEFGKKNSEDNNTSFHAGDMTKLFNRKLFNKEGHPDVIIADPPRAGMHPKVTETILKAAPQKIVYVSCDPATQARDIHKMSEQYSVQRIRPVDMFPHTYHIENIVLLTKK